MPLFHPEDFNLARAVIFRHFQEAAQVEISWCAKYLGVMVGPDSPAHCLTEPIIKYAKVALRWSHLHLGCQYDAMVYRIFAVSIFQFWLQFFGPDAKMLEAEVAATSRLFKGPGNRVSRSLLQALKVQLHAPYDVPNLEHLGLASKMRLRMAEDFLKINRQKELDHAFSI